jgi:hypothetical protein
VTYYLGYREDVDVKVRYCPISEQYNGIDPVYRSTTLLAASVHWKQELTLASPTKLLMQ